MALVNAPYGFQPINSLSGTPRAIRMPFGIASGQAGNIFKYSPITIEGGVIVLADATTDPIWGIFAGVEFCPVGGRPTESPFWPDGQTYDSTFNMFVYFWAARDPTLRLLVQADGSVAQALMGAEFNIANPTAGSTATGLAASGLLHAGAGSGQQGQFFLEEFGVGVNDQLGGGDAYTTMIVGVARAQVGGAPQVSIA